MNEIYTITRKMIRVFSGDPKRIQHLIKVHSFATIIAEGESLDAPTREVLEIAALVHDIGIKTGEEMYSRNDGAIQEKLGPEAARELLADLCDERTLNRICFLVGHHHTYTGIEGLDHRILVESDFLANLQEDDANRQAIRSAYDKVFRTKTGRWLCETIFAKAFIRQAS